MKYTIEKVLYFANEASRLHVAPDEFKRKTTLGNIVRDLEKQGKLSLVGSDDSGFYYATTLNGEIDLLERQIEWRKAHGKDCSEHRKKLGQVVQGTSRQLRA